MALKKNWFAVHWILGVVFLLAVAGAAVAGVYYWQTVRNIPQSVTLPVHTEKVDPTANWKTYTNDQYGFEFKYPANLYDDSDELAFRIKSSPLKIAGGGGVKPDGVEGKDWALGYEISIAKQDTKDVNLVSQGEYKVTKVDNLPGIEAYDISGDVPSGGPTIYIKNPKVPNSFILAGYGNGLTDSTEVDRIFYQILSSFKFTDSSSAIYTSKVYTNAKYGFQLTMPDSWIKYIVGQDEAVPSDQEFPSTAYVWFALPLNHKLYGTDYYPVSYIAVTPVNNWKIDACQGATAPGCFQGQELGRNSKYVFEKSQESYNPGSDCTDPNFKSQELYLCSVYFEFHDLGTKDFKLLE